MLSKLLTLPDALAHLQIYERIAEQTENIRHPRQPLSPTSFHSCGPFRTSGHKAGEQLPDTDHGIVGRPAAHPTFGIALTVTERTAFQFHLLFSLSRRAEPGNNVLVVNQVRRLIHQCSLCLDGRGLGGDRGVAGLLRV